MTLFAYRSAPRVEIAPGSSVFERLAPSPERRPRRQSPFPTQPVYQFRDSPVRSPPKARARPGPARSERDDPTMSFDAFGLDPQLRRAVADLGFAEPTPIQRDAIPPALARRDVLACAMTGSGKTAAFLLPILHQLIDRPRGATRALVLSPTRELAAQIAEHLRELARHTPLRGAAVYGGVAMGPQEQAFRRGVDVLVATPGPPARPLPGALRPARRARVPGARRGRPHARHGLPAGRPPRPAPPARAKRRQTFFFSATLPPPIVQLARELLATPAAINIERPAAPAHGITQAVYPVPRGAQALPAARAAAPRRHPQRHRLHPHQAPRQPPRRLPRQARRRLRAPARQPQPAPAHRGPGRASRPAPAGCWWRPTSRRAASTSRRSRT